MKEKATSGLQHINPDSTLPVRVDPLSEWIFQKPSPIHGTGVFASKQIQPEQRIYWALPVLGYSEYQEIIRNLPAKEQEYFLMTATRVYDVRNSVLRYLNHSRTPNMDWGDGYLIAKRDVQPGDELTINYGWEHYEWEPSADQKSAG